MTIVQVAAVVSAWHVPYPCLQASGTMRTVTTRGLPSWRQGKEGHGCCRAREETGAGPLGGAPRKRLDRAADRRLCPVLRRSVAAAQPAHPRAVRRPVLRPAAARHEPGLAMPFFML